MNYKVGYYVKHKKQNIEGKVVRIDNGITHLSNKECSSSHYFVKAFNPIYGILIGILGILFSIISYIII